MIASMGAAGRYLRPPFRGKRAGASIGRTREIWPCADGFVSLRAAGRQGARPQPRNDHPARRRGRHRRRRRSRERDWSAYNHNTVTDDELRRDRGADRRVLRGAHDGGALRDRVRDQPDAGAGQLAAGALRSRHHSRPREFFAARRPAGAFAIVRPGPATAAGVRPIDVAPIRHAGDRRRVGGHEDPGVRVGRGRARSPPATSRSTARRCCASSRGRAPTSCAPTPSAPKQPPWARGLRHVRRPQRRQAQRHPQHQAPRRRRARQTAGRRVGRRRRRELRAQGDAGLRARLRRPRRRAARPGDDQRLPAGPDRPAPGLPGLRRPGLGAVGLQLPHRLARPRARRPLRHDHRLAGTALRRRRARRRAAVPPAHGPGRLPRPVTGRGGGVVAVAVAARLRRRRHDRRARNGNDDTPGGAATALFACAGDDRWVAIAAWDDDELDAAAKARRRRSRGVVAPPRSPLEVAEALQAAGVEAVPVQDFGDVHDDPATRAPRSLRARSTHPFLGEGATSATASGCQRRRRVRPQRPTLGQDNDDILGDILGLSAAEREQLAADGVLE